MKIREIANKIKEFDTIGITCHVSPDGDAMGSSLALYEAIKTLGKKVYIISKESIPNDFKFLKNSVEVSEDKENVLEGIQCVIVVDCGNKERINGNLNFENRNYKIINIDHHVSNENYGDYNYVDSKSAATCEIIYSVIKELGVTLNKDIATCIYTGLLTDTGSFRHSTTSKYTHEVAGYLIETGIDFSEIHRTLFDRKSMGKIKLYGKAIDTIELSCDNKFCTMYITRDMLEELNLLDEDTSDVITFGNKIESVEVVALIKEREDGGVKVSLRSKRCVDVNKIAGVFNGGGHVRASGFASAMDIKNVKFILNEILCKELI
ncbi:MAG: bifunctional oligoribonuclease/PAP phosphatase NrnA [Clostridium sp.]